MEMYDLPQGNCFTALPRLQIIALEDGNEGASHSGSETIEGLNLDLGANVIEPGTEVPDIFRDE